MPAKLTCSIANATGVMGTADVYNVVVNCVTQSFGIGGTIRGLNSTGLVLANGSDWLTVPAGATTFTMHGSVAIGTRYAVSVATQPTGLSCSVSTGAGTMPAAAVDSVAVTCSEQAYTLGGTLSGLTSSGLVLTDGTDWVPVATSAAVFSMPTGVAFSSIYTITVAAQPAGLNCTVIGGSGSMPAGTVASVQVSCVARNWTWESGSNRLSAGGVSGTQGAGAPGNVPGARLGSMTWNGTAGRRWLFGGTGYDESGGSGDLSDLWSYSQNTNQWTWVSGPKVGNDNGTYGTPGIAAVGNEPNARKNSATWTDSQGTLWLFGGYHDNTGHGYMNDLWSYKPGTGLWTWWTGSSTSDGSNDSCTNALGVYGAQGIAAPGNTPGARLGSVTWIDASGRLWLLGGIGCDSVGALNILNDLWSYQPGTNQWTWVGGSTSVGATGRYGKQNLAAAGNVPGARQAAVSWVDSAGRFWVLGGYGVDSTGTSGNLSDLWSYDPTTHLWVWVDGPNVANVAGVYGAKGNGPGARSGAQSWTDSKGHLLLFGGAGLDSQGNGGFLNDLWSYDPAAQQWTWVSGSNVIDGVGVYGDLGVSAAANVPGARFQSVGWIDSADHLWLFGGYGLDYTADDYDGPLNDLFEY